MRLRDKEVETTKINFSNTIFSCNICKFSCKIETIDMATAIEVSDEGAPEILPTSVLRKVYLITYSNANIELFDREKFSAIITESFTVAATKFAVIQWACCMEKHKNGAYHFHMCILLDKCQRWLKVKKYIQDHHHIIVDFSGHSGYHTAFNYVAKEDEGFIKSENHPEVAAPKTAKATKAKSAKKGLKPSKQVKRLCNSDVAKMILKMQ